MRRGLKWNTGEFPHVRSRHKNRLYRGVRWIKIMEVKSQKSRNKLFQTKRRNETGKF
jgi:hypothetical protein